MDGISGRMPGAGRTGRFGLPWSDSIRLPPGWCDVGPADAARQGRGLLLQGCNDGPAGGRRGGVGARRTRQGSQAMQCPARGTGHPDAVALGAGQGGRPMMGPLAPVARSRWAERPSIVARLPSILRVRPAPSPSGSPQDDLSFEGASFCVVYPPGAATLLRSRSRGLRGGQRPGQPPRTERQQSRGDHPPP